MVAPALPPALRPTLGLLIVAAGLHSAWLVFGWGGAEWREWFSDLHYLLVVGLFLVAVGQLFARSTGPLRVAFAWLLAHALVRFAAEGSWAYLELIVRVPPFPSFADGLYFLAYLLQGAAFVLLARLPLLGLRTARLALDSLIVVGAVGVFSWQLFLAGIAGDASEPLVSRLVSLTYPVLDLFLLSLLLLAVFRHQRLRAHEVFFALGLGLNIIGDFIFVYLTQTGSYVTGHPVDALWAWSFVLEGLGAAFAVRVGPRASRRPGTWQVRLTLLSPYLALLASFALLLALYQRQTLAVSGVLWGTALVTVLVMVRQIVMFIDNARLHRALTAREAELEHLAHHDPLTGLPNRRALTAHLEEAVRRARASGTRLALLFVDLDGFKHINDTLGHAAGDAALREVARRLRENAPAGAQVARLSGDEFAVVVPDLAEADAALPVGEALLSALTAPLALPGTGARVGASVGVAVWPDHVPDAGGLLRSADSAMYHVKLRGKNGVRLFSPELDAEWRGRQEIERHLRGALDRGEFRLHYQPQCGPGGEVVGAEALLRWTHPELGEVPPRRFVPVAEDLGLIGPLGEWVLREACRQAAAWRAGGLPLRVAVNVSPAQFAQADFPAQVRAALESAGLPGSALDLEITERLLVQDMARTAHQLALLGGWGVRISIDDFGTGHSALAYLLRLPISALKVDRGFVQELDEAGQDGVGAARVVQAVAGLAHNLGLTVVAEGVEEPWQRQRVLDLGCDYVQGYFLARPLPPAEFERWWRAHEAGRGVPAPGPVEVPV
ncbi:diguanylate cyclase/phosphodiesterase [Deinococcus aerius]|uniref:Diguanylate cyclase/phosphodiesterase n=2 Tax=Deinococcus aerius TaxID=200253 RepID=A0A2I9D0L4_9DEIO|nr:diguanylate cyclase/phosphodiesterase [Deinococcus aerius]